MFIRKEDSWGGSLVLCLNVSLVIENLLLIYVFWMNDMVGKIVFKLLGFCLLVLLYLWE